jgi:dTDP-4-dehydrorhamnose reductase
LKSKVLLIGGSGNLGAALKKSKLFKKIDSPQKKNLNLLNIPSINKFLNKKYSIIINCAAMARMTECEKKPNKAFQVNVIGTLNLVKAINKYKKNIRLIHISSDAVYPSTKGNYSEKSVLKPYNFYGWTKLCSELIVKKLKNYVVIRTRFFNKNNIRFDTAATDIFTSMIEVKDLAKEIRKISLKNFIGVINIGNKKKSDFDNYKKYSKAIKPCLRKDITKHLSFKIAKDASMNLGLLKKLKNK